MTIKWLGHSCFKLTESTGTSVVTDPYHPMGEVLPKVKADAVTVSHKHDDHNAVELVDAPVVLDQVRAYELNGIHIYSVMSYHDNKKGARRGRNLIFRFRMDGVEICHLGDVGEELTPLLAELLTTPINVLLIPVGGNYTIDARQAKEYVDYLMPDIVIPMHYKTDDCKLDIDEIDEFLDLFDKNDIEYIQDDSVHFDRTDFDGETTKVYVMKKATDEN